MTDIDPDDVAAMRRENGGKDFRLFMRQQIRDGQARRDKPARPAAAPPPPGYRPGAWPQGTSPPGPLKPQPPGAWDHALERYRRGEGRKSDPCHCGGCDTPDNHTEEN